MAGFGLYVHIPFCRRICPYCDFNVRPVASADWAGLQQALLGEVRWGRQEFTGPVKTVYFGGGTPSLARPELIASVLEEADRTFGVVPNAEVSLEVDPGTAGAAKLKAFKEAGINRLSIGWQSAKPPVLEILGRAHEKEDGDALVSDLVAAGFDNFSADLIFAVPGQTVADLEEDLDRLLEIEPTHLSLYGLTYEPSTPFYRWRQEGRLVPATDELEREMMVLVRARLTAAGYEHYEVSSYARPGFQSKHNSGYWNLNPHLGVGPGAVSLQRAGSRGARHQSLRDPAVYVSTWNSPDPEPCWESSEDLSDEQVALELLIGGARRARGLRYNVLPTRLQDSVRLRAEQAQARGWIVRDDGGFAPTFEGLLNADALALLLSP